MEIRLRVNVPAETPAESKIFLAGSLPSVGAWKADGVKLERQADGTHVADLNLEPGQTLEFKITRGSWETVEKTADGGERANRSVTIDANTKQIDVTVERWSAGEAARASTVVGTLELHTIDSKSLGRPRTIRVWLPPGYEADGSERYDVLYMHDGQNCFDAATSSFGNEWRIDETLTELITKKTVRPIIVVGIDNGGAERINELTFAANPILGGGQGAKYTAMLLDEVMPLVARTYRVEAGKAHTFLGGSSLGGIVSLEIARRHPDTFAGVIAMSPALWWADRSTITTIEKDIGGLKDTRVWLDMGTREQGDAGAKDASHVANARRMDEVLTEAGVEHRLVIEEGAAHNEAAWAKRFSSAIEYLLAK